jgi:hypothetical protein
LFLIEKSLAQSGFERPRGETFAHWLRRLAATPAFRGPRQRLQTLVDLHYRYRFDPAGLSASERKALTEQARHWLGRLAAGDTAD